MSEEDDRRVLGEINGVKIVESRPGDHAFSHYVDGDQPKESRIVCACGWQSESRPGAELDIDVHFAEINGISYEEQKRRTAKVLQQLRGEKPDPEPEALN